MRIEARSQLADDYPVSSDGFCTTDRARQSAQGKPCSKLEVVSGTFREAFGF